MVMGPEQFLTSLQKQTPPAACLFLGAEPYRLDLCRKALIRRLLPEEERQEGLTRHDLTEMTLSEVIDDARSLSLFSPRRVIWVSSAEAALPRAKSGAGEAQEEGAASLAEYIHNPSPGVVLALEASRYGLEGEDKAKAERVRKFYSAIPVQVECPGFTVQEARQLAHELVKEAGLQLKRQELDLLVESLGADALRIAGEIEKLRLFAAGGREIRAGDLAALVPDSSVSTVFVLIDALGSGDRLRALSLLDTLTRQGEYLPLALTFLATLFRLALAAQERGLRGPQQIQQQLSAPGRPIWRSRAEQIHRAATIFTTGQLETAIQSIYATDKAMRSARPDDRIVMENLILRLTG